MKRKIVVCVICIIIGVLAICIANKNKKENTLVNQQEGNILGNMAWKWKSILEQILLIEIKNALII